MKKIFLTFVALFAIGLGVCQAQVTRDSIVNADRLAKLEKFCKKQPASTGIKEVDAYTSAVYTAAVAALASNEQLLNLYSREVGETKDGVTDVTVTKPTLQDWTVLSATVAAEVVSLTEAGKLAAKATTALKDFKDPMKAAKAAKIMKASTELYPLLGEEIAAQGNAVKSIIETLKSGRNL